MKQTYVEVSCDRCGRPDYYKPGSVDAQARKDGWIVTRDGKHFCTRECRDAYTFGLLVMPPNTQIQRAP